MRLPGRLVALWALALVMAHFAGCGTDLKNHHPIIPPHGIDGPKRIYENDTGEYTCGAYDPDGDSLVYGWTSSSGFFVDFEGATAYWKAACPPGGAWVEARVADLRGGWATQKLGISVLRASESTPAR